MSRDRTARRRSRGLLASAVGLSLLAATGGVLAATTARASAKTHRGAPLPSGWEICILQGLGAPATSANVADLDAWQAAEGGSTDNTMAYNPFNTMRGTDQSGAAVPAKYTVDGFPMFGNWAAGCAATVATLLQPNMAAIVTALQTGDISPPAAFLATVDQTQWCAPDAGVPCYNDLITGGITLATSSALGLVHDASDALAGYDRALTKEKALRATLAAERQQVTVDDVELAIARLGLQHTTTVLRSLALYDYTSNPSLDHMTSLLARFHPPDQTDLLSQYYAGLDSSAEVGRFERAKAVLAGVQSTRDAAAASAARTEPQLASAETDTAHAVGKLDIQFVSLQAAGACTAPASDATAPGDPPAVVGTVRSCLAALNV